MSRKPRVPLKEHLVNDLASTKLCLCDKTWHYGNVGYVKDLSTISRENKILMNMSQEQLVMFVGNPENDLVSTKLCLRDKTWNFGFVDYMTEFSDCDDVTISPTSTNNILTNMSQEPRVFEEIPENDDISTKLCLCDKTWHFGNVVYVTELPNIEVIISPVNMSQEPGNDLVSTKLCLDDDTWPKMEEIEQNQIGSRIIRKTVSMTDTIGCFSLSTTEVEDCIVKYLRKREKERLKQGDSIIVEMLDCDTNVMHYMFMWRFNFEQDYYLTDTMTESDIVRMRGLKTGDKIEFSWDSSRYRLCFRLLSRAVTEASIISGRECLLF